MKKTDNREVVQAISMVLQFGLNMIVPILMCTLIGVWIGDKWDMDWIVIPLFFVGVLAGYTNIFKMLKGFLKDKDESRDRNVKKN